MIKWASGSSCIFPPSVWELAISPGSQHCTYFCIYTKVNMSSYWYVELIHKAGLIPVAFLCFSVNSHPAVRIIPSTIQPSVYRVVQLQRICVEAAYMCGSIITHMYMGNDSITGVQCLCAVHSSFSLTGASHFQSQLSFWLFHPPLLWGCFAH